MIIYRCILPQYARLKYPNLSPVVEGVFSDLDIQEYNKKSYNIYYLPNYFSKYSAGNIVRGKDIDTFEYCFVDFDLKSKTYKDKESFLAAVGQQNIPPTKVIDTGNGVHVYWRVSNLDAVSYLKLTRRLMHLFNTDPAVGQIYQLMRYPGTLNTKIEDAPLPCETLYESDAVYSREELDTLLPTLTPEEEEYCVQHYNRTYGIVSQDTEIDDTLPPKFASLLSENSEAKNIWLGNVEDRSKGDYRLGHIMWASKYTKDEALSVLVNSAKALFRAPSGRISYAAGIVNKIWAAEENKETFASLSNSVKYILNCSTNALEGTRFHCHKWVDNTYNGFRLGHVIGLVGGSGVGKTAVALNMFEGFVACNPDYDHIFVSLEQGRNEIALRWKTMCGDNDNLHEKVHIIDNYDENGVYRDLSLTTIQDYILQYQKTHARKIGCVVIDHIGVLSNNDRLGQDEGVKKLCKQMKTFASQTNTLLIMQSQTSREKAGIGDLELNKDAAFGTSVFENFCDYLITIWQPLKRCYTAGAPTVCAFKFCKIRHKKQHKDNITEDTRYLMIFDPDTEKLRFLTSQEEKSFSFFNKQAVGLRKQDRKTEVMPYVSVRDTTNV